MHSRRGLVLLFGAFSLGALFVFGPRIPRDQNVEIVLGSDAPRVTQLELRYAPASSARYDFSIMGRAHASDSMDRDWTREVTFRYGQGVSPPRVAHHEPRLPDGDYQVEVDLFTMAGKNSVTRNVRLTSGGSTSIDVAEAIPR